MLKKKLFCVFLVVIVLFSVTINASALFYPDSFYNNISWTWEYNAPYTNSYNCLGYATGSLTWEWPWGNTNPTSSQVDAYLKLFYNYNNAPWGQPYQPKIISYGLSNSVAHFSKVPSGSSSYCYSKWGGLERFKHYSWSPYNAGSVYGLPVKVYY